MLDKEREKESGGKEVRGLQEQKANMERDMAHWKSGNVALSFMV